MACFFVPAKVILGLKMLIQVRDIFDIYADAVKTASTVNDNDSGGESLRCVYCEGRLSLAARATE